MTYGTSAYSQTPYSFLPYSSVFTLNGVANGLAISQTIATGIEYKTLIAILKVGGVVRVHADKGGNIISAVINSDKDRIDFKVLQNGSIRDGYITNPNKFMYFEILKSQIGT